MLGVSPIRGNDLSAPVEFPDGRFLLTTLFAGRSQLLIGKPGGNFFPLVDTLEETSLPAAALKDNQVALMAGTGSLQTIAIASASDGRIIRRLQGCKGKTVTSLAASTDGNTLYYTVEGILWAIPSADGPPRKISAGDGVAVDPNGRDLIVSLVEKDGVHLVRIPVDGGTPQDIHVQTDLSIVPLALGASSLNKSGKLVIGVVPRDSWFFRAAVLDLASGKFTSIPLDFAGDVFMFGWTNDGHVLAYGEQMHSHIWRLRPLR